MIAAILAGIVSSLAIDAGKRVIAPPPSRPRTFGWTTFPRAKVRR